jgi:hypothetical protein
MWDRGGRHGEDRLERRYFPQNVDRRIADVKAEREEYSFSPF